MQGGKSVLFAKAQLRVAALCFRQRWNMRPAHSLLSEIPLVHQTRSLYLSKTLLDGTSSATSATASTSAPATGNSSGVTALDVAMRVNKLKRLHQTGGGPTGKKQIELDAWSELNSLNEEQINTAEGKEVSLLLNSWAYFAKFWEKGKDGPLSAMKSSSAPVSDESDKAEGTGASSS